MKLLEALIRIREEGPKLPRSGICANLLAIGTHVMLSEFVALVPSWPKCSKTSGYPIPSPYISASSDIAYHAYGNYMWNPDHPYGALRLELLNWCIKQLSTSE